MPKRAIALAAVLVTATLTPPTEATAADPPTPPAPDLDETLASLELPSRPAEALAPPAVKPSTASNAAADSERSPQAKPVRPGEALARIRSCESGSNYRARSASGRYHGAYQFDRATFASVGGKGDPAAASPAEQDRRAKILYSKRGGSAWPVCAKQG